MIERKRLHFLRSLNFKKLKERKVLYTTCTIALVIVILILVIVYFSFPDRKKFSPLDAIPSDAALIFEIKQPHELWSELSNNSGVWRELANLEPFSKINTEICFIDSIFKTDKCALSIIADHSIYISFHSMNDGTTGVLYLTDLCGNCSSSSVAELIKQSAGSKATITVHSFSGTDITNVALPDKKEKFSYAISKDIFICSFQPLLVESAIKQQKSSTKFYKDRGFANVSETAGKKVNANLYVNFKYFPQLFSSLVSNNYKKILYELTGFASWSALDVSINKDAILLNGFTSVSDSDTNFFSIFAKQELHEMSMLDIIPSSTASFIYFGFSDFDNWYKLYSAYLDKKGKLTGRNAQITKINSLYKTNIEKKITSWIGKEMALVITEPSDSDIASSTFVVIKANNIVNAINLLDGKPVLQAQKVTPKSAPKNKKQKNSKSKGKRNDKRQVTKKTVSVDVPVEVDGNKIYEYNAPGALPAIFGMLFNGVQGKYYTIINDYVIFGNSPSALVSFLKEYADGKSLNDNNDYVSFSKNISNESNLYLYCNIRKSLGIFLNYANKGIYNYIGNNLRLFKNFEAFAYQLKASGKLFYNNVCLKTNTTIIEESNALWTISLDSTVFSKPQVIIDKADKSKKIIAFDNASNIYLINKDGSLLWKLKLKEKPISNVFVIDYYKKGKSQYVFNTQSYIYCIDENGKNVENFPLHLSDVSTAPMNVVDYANNKDYRFIIPCKNKILNFTKDGSQSKGWTIVKTKSDVNKEVTYLKLGGTDCFVTSDKDGNIYIFDRKGIEKIKIKSFVTASPISGFYAIKGNKKNKASILTTDNTGNLIFISSSGDVEKKSLSKFSSAHYFLYEDINNDKMKEYIFVDNNKLFIYGSAFKQICSFTLPYEISAFPLFYKESGNKGSLGMVSLKTNKIFLIKNGCELGEKFPLNGSTPFEITSLNNDGSLNLIVGSESRILNYSFE